MSLKNLPNARLDKLHRISAKLLSHLRKNTPLKSFLQLLKYLNCLSHLRKDTLLKSFLQLLKYLNCLSHLRKDTFLKSFLQLLKYLNNLVALLLI
jgi:hypothetical protein